MKFIKYLKEEYTFTFKSWASNVTIFCNPDKKEMAELKVSDYPDVRFIIDFKNKKLFAWIYTVHNEAYKALVSKNEIKDMGIYNNSKSSKVYFFGLGAISGGKIDYKYSHVLGTVPVKDRKKFQWLGDDLSWLSPHFTNLKFLTLDYLLKNEI